VGLALSWREFLIASALGGAAVWLAPHQLFAEHVGIVNLARSSAAMVCKEVWENLIYSQPVRLPHKPAFVNYHPFEITPRLKVRISAIKVTLPQIAPFLS